jgi:DNA-binding NarL/FixJ family response regulator
MENNLASVLVIESHPMLRESLCAAINTEPDLTVVEPGTGDPDAFQLMISILDDVIFLDRKPDIVLLALDNPGLEGLQTLAMLHKDLPRTPILALVSDEVPGQEQAALLNGAAAVSSKTGGRAELLKALRAIKANPLFALLPAE